jgi:alkylation response protein AidB-like acyl-CoA dehydrogenase
MDFALNAEQRDWQLKAREFAAKEIRPLSLARDQIADPAATWDWDIIKKGSKLGFRTLGVPKEWGGPGADLVTQCLVMAELARGDSAISKAFSQNWKWSQLMAVVCTKDQQARFLKSFIADDTYMLGGARTEPNVGSDHRMTPNSDPKTGFRLKAERDGDNWILNGEKTFIANGSVGKLFFVSARTDFKVPVTEGSTEFIVPTDTPGFRIGKKFNKAGWRFYQNAELIFENARVPHANIVGEVNGGWKARTSDPSQFNDLELAANAVGVCDTTVEEAMGFVKQQPAGGKPLADQQRVQLKLAEMHMLTESLRAYIMRTAWERDLACAGDKLQAASANAGLVMVYSQEVIQRVTALNRDIRALGGASARGAMHASADKLDRDAFIWTHLAGDSLSRIKTIKKILR